MAEAYRRVISLPEGISDRAAAQLEERLAAAVEAQREFALKSAHVLQFIGSLQKGPGTYYIDHEPAEVAFPPAQLFSRDAQGAPAERLMQVAAAVFHALTTAHNNPSQQTRAHGALCPGVILVTPDGIEKVTDFGFAPAMCAALGADSYLNLAVGPPAEASGDAIVTGIWEVLSAEEFDREDRICAFIDPEKYGSSILEGFEPGSDIIAAGFILHLIAEHQHPYLAEDPDAHRMVDMSSMMDAMRYNNARRQDLRESGDEGVRIWCDLVAKMLARLPGGRPSADEVLKALDPFPDGKPVDAGEALRRRLKALIRETERTPPEQVDWDLVRREVQSITESEAASDGLRSDAKSILAEATGRVLLDTALRLIQGDHWAEAKEPLEEILGLPDLPADLATSAKEASVTLENFLAVGSELEAIEARSLPDGETGPEATQVLAQELLAQIEQLPSDDDLPESLTARRSSLRKQIQMQLDEATAEIDKIKEQERLEAQTLERERQADFKKAEDWLTAIQAALEAKQWTELRESFDARPDLKHWPDNAEARAAAVEKELGDYEAERARLAAIEADAETARQWMNKVQEAVEKQSWDEARNALRQKPKLTHWPEDIVELDRKHTAEVNEFFKKEADAALAHSWFDQIEAAVRSEDWQEAGNALAREPVLDFWPAEIQHQVTEYRRQIEDRLEAAELERRRAEQARLQVQEWLALARQEADSQDWVQALETLKSPPLVKPFPKELRKEADELQTSFSKMLEEARAALKDRRIQEFQSYAVTLVRGLVEKPLGRFLNPELLEISLGDIEFDTPEELDHAGAVLSVGVRHMDPASGETPFEVACEFQMAGDSPELCGDHEDLGRQITTHLRDILTGRQKAGAADLFKQLRNGMFPDIKIHASLDELVERLKVRAALRGTKAKNGNVETDLVWSPDTLVWNHEDPKSFVQRALKIATEATQQVAESNVIEQSQALSQYRSRLAVALEPKGPSSPDSFPESVEMEARLSFQPRSDASPVTLQTVPSRSKKLGEFSLEASLAPAEAKLGELVVEAQNQSRTALENSVEQRIKNAAGKTKPAKIKIVATPKRLKTPQDEVRFDLRARGVQTLSVTPQWDRESLEFVLPGDWDKNLGTFLEDAPSILTGWRRWRPVAIPAVLVLLVGGGWAFSNAGKSDSRPEIVSNTSPSEGEKVPAVQDDHAEGQVDVPIKEVGTEIAEEPSDTGGEGPADGAERGPATPPDATDEDTSGNTLSLGIQSAAKAAREARKILSDSSLFSSEEVVGDLVKETATAKQASIQITFPGLRQRDFKIALTEQDTNGEWALSDEQRRAIKNRAAELVQLLALNKPLMIAEALPNAIDSGMAEFVDPSALALRLNSRGDWMLIDRNWLGSVSKATVELGEEDSAGVPLEPVDWTLQPIGGVITVADSDGLAAQVVKSVIRERLLTAQSESVEELMKDLRIALKANRTEADDAVIEPSEPMTDLRQQAELLVRWEGMQVRRYLVPWNVSQLGFKLEDQDFAQANQDTLAHEIIWSINQVIADDHWIRQASSGPITEFRAPDDKAWVLEVPAPWPIDDETPNQDFARRLPIVLDPVWLDPLEEPQDLARRILAQGITPPQYWPLVKTYANALDGDPAFGFLIKDASDAELQPLIQDTPAHEVMRDQVIPFWRRAQFILPGALLSEGPAQVEASKDGPEVLRFQVDGHWTLAHRPDEPAIMVTADGWVTLTDRVQQLFEPRTCTVSLAIKSGKLSQSWSDGGELVQGFADTWPKAQVLEDAFASLPVRGRLEEALEQRIDSAATADNVQAVVRIDEPTAWNILQDVWGAKGAAETRAADLPSLSAYLQDQLGKRGKLSQQKARATIVPTVFAEYFCGPRFTYCVVWSAVPGSGATAEGPVLLRLCRTDLLSAESGQETLGEVLFDPVFNAVGDACAARRTTEGNFKQQLGIVLAPDGAMSLHALTTLALKPVETDLEPIDRSKGDRADFFHWASLAELETKLEDRLCGFYLTRTLRIPAQWQPVAGEQREAESWAATTLADALGRAK